MTEGVNAEGAGLVTVRAPREIDLAVRPANRLVWLLRLVFRSFQIAFWLGIAVARLPFLRLSRGSWSAALGVAVVFLFTRLGATFIKVGQIMSSRPDVFPESFLEPFLALQDRVPPFPFADVRRIVEEDFGRPLAEVFVEINERPVASASIAQVHRAVLRDAELPASLPSRVVAVKVRRPGIVRRAYLDEAILRFGARLVSLVPTFALVSPLEAIGEFCEAVNLQLDFRIEADNNRRFRKNSENEPHLVFPALVEQLCSDRVLTMEFLDGVKEDKIDALGIDRAYVARKGLESVVRMIFQHGFIHADLHPGNVLFLPGNRFAVLDLGLVGVLSDHDRRRYALLGYYIVSGLALDVVRWAYEEFDASRVTDRAALERDVAAVLGLVHDKSLEDLQLTVALTAAYDVLRRHRVRVSAKYTIANIAMMVVEGISRRIDPKVNLTREARPYLEAALALSPTLTAGEAAASISLPAAVPPHVAGGRYRIRRLLGEGVRKRVYLARDTRLERDVALALIRTEDLDAAGLARIRLEARAVARLADHPRIVPVYDTGDEDGVPYVVSQYMGGGTLSGRLLKASEQHLPLETVLRFADQICQALEYAHGHGVVHRDVKPENVWLTEDGFAKLGDFGLARLIGRPQGTLDGMTVGTALYMPPEQALGREVDHRSDLYSLGATIYELLTGRPPFEGETVAEVIASHIHAEPEPPSRRNPQVPPGLDGVILRLLAKRPENRFESAAAARQALRDLATAAAPVAAVPDGPETGPVFFGREEEMQRLRRGFEDAVAGRGRFCVLVGEPGIGKTRAADLLASYAARRGSLVLTGRSFEGEGAPAFWPWVQILRAYLDGRDSGRVESEVGPGAAYVAHLVPRLREVMPELPVLAGIENEEARFRLFDAIVSFLKRAATTQPLVVFLDDLHWADKPSLLLLQFLVRELAGARIFVVGAYRDVDVQHGHPLAELLPALRREHAFERILLRGLPESDVRALVAARAGAAVPEAFVRAIHRETEGNPFFIEETLRHLVEEGVITREEGRWTSRVSPDEMGLPEGVREVVGRRLARLGEECRRVLTIASVLGRDFDARALEQVTGMEASRVRELLGEALTARIVEDTGTERRRFTHALIRETLYAAIGPAERVRLHRAIADVLERLYAAGRESHLAELAYHFCEAAPAGGADRAIEYATLAAQEANQQLAYEEAVPWFARALRVLETKPDPSDSERAEILLGLGLAEWRSAEYTRAKATLLRAADVAERCGRADVLAQAAITSSGGEGTTLAASVGSSSAQVPLLERALRAQPDEDSALRAMLMGGIAAALTFSEEQERRHALIEESLAMAKRCGDDRTIAGLLMLKLTARWGSDTLDVIREDVETMARIGERTRDERLRACATGFRALIASETGDVDAAALLAAEGHRIASRTRDPQVLYTTSFVQSAIAVCREPNAAEPAIRRTFELAGTGNDVAFGVYVVQAWTCRWQRGEGGDIASVIGEILQTRALPERVFRLLRTMVAVAAAEAGRTQEAREIFDANMPEDLGSIHRDTFRLASFVMSARVASLCDDLGRARVAHDLLLPFADRNVVAGGCVIFGSVAKYLGLTAKTLGRLDDAVRYFETAAWMERGMPAFLAETRKFHAEALLRRGAAGDRVRALELLAEAIEGARAHGARPVADRALALKLEIEGIAAESPSSSIERVAASIEEKRPDLAPAAAADGTVTLLFTDMEDFSGMTERLGDRRAHEVMREHNRILRAEAPKHGGFEVDSQGDGFLFAFSSARRGLQCAVGIQAAFAARAEASPAEEPIRVRIGLHTGEAIREGNTFFGRTVIQAARIAAAARGGEILVSGLVRGLLTPDVEIPFGPLREIELKGLSGKHLVCAVGWDGKEPAGPVAAAAFDVASRSIDGNVFLRAGDYWTLTYEGKTLSLRDTKGMRYLARLLSEAGREIHALDLVGGETPSGAKAVEGTVTTDLGSAGEILDPQARADYRARLVDLESELDEARSANDLGRAQRLQEEVDFLGRELSAAFGLGGRSRKAGEAAERARKAVYSRISDSLVRIRKENPALARHLENSLQFGVFCAYRPEKQTTWKV